MSAPRDGAPSPVSGHCTQEWALEALAVYPVKGEPGRALRQATLTDSGLLGDRRKRHPLLIASVEEATSTTDEGGSLRANLVVAMPAEVLAAASGRELRVGEAVVRIDRRPSACAGMYAEVVVPGDILVGDRCRLEG